jgi:transposase-like protein
MLSAPGYCHSLVTEARWPDGRIRCPSCGSDDLAWLPTRRLWACRERHAAARFSVKAGTLFEDSPLSLDRWLRALWLYLQSQDGVTSRHLQETLGVTQKTAWFMLRRIQLAVNSSACRRRLPKSSSAGPLGPERFRAVLQAILAVRKADLDQLVFWAAVDSPRNNNPAAPGRKPKPRPLA